MHGTRRLAAAMAVAAVVAAAAQAAELKLVFPLGRSAYQTNQAIELAVLRTNAGPLAASTLHVTVSGDDGSRLDFAFPAPAVPAADGQARRTEHVRLNGWLLRPGHYRVEVECDAAAASAELDVFSHVRKSTFRLIDWGNVKGAEHEAMGEDGIGFNLMYGQYRLRDATAQAKGSIRGGLDFMQVCTMGGAHQMDIRLECDWSDPLVMLGGCARLSQQAFLNRTAPNCVGVHFYDEPGLTWGNHPVTGEWTPHGIAAQERAFASAFGRKPLPYNEVKPDDPAALARWNHWARWKLQFVESAWKIGRDAVEHIRPDFIAANQSQYAWYAYTDGYYFNVARSLPVISGHGGYDDMPLGYMQPSWYFEFGRVRDLDKDAWYLPAWYGNIPAWRFRAEQYLSFMTNLHGMMTPPGLKMQRPATVPGAEGVVESNHLMARLGTIFNAMPVTRPPVAVLYSISQCIHAQTKDMTDNYDGGGHRTKLMYLYLAGKLIQHDCLPIVEEDVLDGTLAAHHKAVVLVGIDHLEPRVAAALAAFAADGGLVLVSDDCKVAIAGATRLGCAVDISLSKRLEALWKEGKQDEMWAHNLVGNFVKAAQPLAKALRTRLDAARILPVFTCDEPGIAASRQAEGDIEYLFATNASYDFAVGGKNSLRAATATIEIPSDGRPVYDAVRGGTALEFRRRRGRLQAELRFGPGQMRVFARTARPIGGVQALTPTIARDTTRAAAPLSLQIGAVVVDEDGRVLAGAAPLHIRVVDPLGAIRYDLYRATRMGHFRTALPLGANDPAGRWTVAIRELLGNADATASFDYTPAVQCGAVAGLCPRAVLFGRDRENVFRFFRTHRHVTVAVGSGEYAAAVDRLVGALKPWDVRCTVVDAKSVKARPITDDEAKTWCGMHPGRVKPGPANNPAHVGFDIRGAAVLVGTPKDNPLIDFVDKQGFLPYKLTPEVPGPGRGLVAWQRDAVSYGAESVTLIATDAAGMAEAIGSLYEAASGLTPLTPLELPQSSRIAAARQRPEQAPEPAVAWQAVLPDRAVAIRPLPRGQAAVLTLDGSLTVLDTKGRAAWQEPVAGGEHWSLAASADGSTLIVGASQQIATFTSKGKSLFAAPAAAEAPAPLVTAVAAAPDGSAFALATSDGKLALLDRKGQRQWAVGGVRAAEMQKWTADTAKWKQDLARWEAEAKAWDDQYKGKDGKKPPRPARPQQPKKPVPDPYLAVVFASDGKTIAALTAREAHVVRAANGQRVGDAAAATGAVEPSGVAGKLLVTDGRRAVAWLSTTEGRLVSTVAMPTDGVASLAATGDGVVVATEPDGTVRKLKAVAGKAAEQVAWEHRVPRRLVKKVAASASRVAVACWGGTLRVLDAGGAPVGQAHFGCDIADVAWAGTTLVVGLADGRVLGLDAGK